MGVETPIPPKTINAAAPGGAPPRRIKTIEKNYLPILMTWVRIRSVHACFFREKKRKSKASPIPILMTLSARW